MLASRVTLDSQGRLILRENGKIILPYEHFANAVMLKHMNGPHGLHLNVDATVRAVSIKYGQKSEWVKKENHSFQWTTQSVSQSDAWELLSTVWVGIIFTRKERKIENKNALIET